MPTKTNPAPVAADDLERDMDRVLLIEAYLRSLGHTVTRARRTGVWCAAEITLASEFTLEHANAMIAAGSCMPQAPEYWPSTDTNMQSMPLGYFFCYEYKMDGQINSAFMSVLEIDNEKRKGELTFAAG